MALTIEESQVKEAVLIADKGFFSNANMALLSAKKLQYIVPLKRSSTLIDYAPCEIEGRKGFTNYLRFNDRVIWYQEKEITLNDENQRVILFLDEDLRRNEQHDYLQRIEKDYQIILSLNRK